MADQATPAAFLPSALQERTTNTGKLIFGRRRDPLSGASLWAARSPSGRCSRHAPLNASTSDTGSARGSNANSTVKIELNHDKAEDKEEKNQTTRRIGLLADAACLLHRADRPHFECPERLQTAAELLYDSGLSSQLHIVPARLATFEELICGGIHSRAHVAHIVRTCAEVNKDQEHIDHVFLKGSSNNNSKCSVSPTADEELISFMSTLSIEEKTVDGKSGQYDVVQTSGIHLRWPKHFSNSIDLIADAASHSAEFTQHVSQASLVEQALYQSPPQQYSTQVQERINLNNNNDDVASENDIVAEKDSLHAQGNESPLAVASYDTHRVCCSYLDNLDDVYISSGSAVAARLSVGGLLEMCHSVLGTADRLSQSTLHSKAKSKLAGGMALVRPPGHHAESRKAWGFCLFNNVAVVAKNLLSSGAAKRIAIVDFDVHHGNGTQRMFYDSPDVLYVSIHRHDQGKFYPANLLNTGYATEVGADGAKGLNVNVPLPCSGLGDTEYSFSFSTVILPILREFSPDLILVSAGFDAADGDPLGGMRVSPDFYGKLTAAMQNLYSDCAYTQTQRATQDENVSSSGVSNTSVAQQRSPPVVLALEGGYNPQVVGECVVSCVRALLSEPSKTIDLSPCKPASAGLSSREMNKYKAKQRRFLASIREVLRVQSPYWNCLDSTLSKSQTQHFWTL